MASSVSVSPALTLGIVKPTSSLIRSPATSESAGIGCVSANAVATARSVIRSTPAARTALVRSIGSPSRFQKPLVRRTTAQPVALTPTMVPSSASMNRQLVARVTVPEMYSAIMLSLASHPPAPVPSMSQRWPAVGTSADGFKTVDACTAGSKPATLASWRYHRPVPSVGATMLIPSAVAELSRSKP